VNSVMPTSSAMEAKVRRMACSPIHLAILIVMARFSSTSGSDSLKVLPQVLQRRRRVSM